MIKKRKKSKSIKTTKQVITGAAVGTVIGAVAGVIIAPKTGKETRRNIAEKSKEVATKSKEIVEKSKEKIVDTYETKTTKPASRVK